MHVQNAPLMLMGLFNWFLKRKMRRQMVAFDEIKSKELLAYADEYLKRSTGEHEKALKIAERINRAQLMNIQTSQLKQELKSSLEGPGEESDDDDDDEEEETGGIESKLMNQIISAVTSRIQSPQLSPGVPPASAAGDGLASSSLSQQTLDNTSAAIPMDLLREKAKKYGFNKVDSMSDQEIKNMMLGL